MRGETALPAKAETVAAFVDAMAEHRAPATVRRYVASIAVAHRVLGCTGTLKSPAVRLALKRMHRCRGRRQGQATGLTWPLRQRLVEAAGDRPIDDRNRALLAVAYDTLLRRAELVSCKCPICLRKWRRRQPPGAPRQDRLRRAWARSSGSGGTASGWCGRGSTAAASRAGPVPLGRQGRAGRRRTSARPGAAHPQGHGAPRRLPETVVQGLSGHSARVGAAAGHDRRRIELPAILQAGRWKSPPWSTAMASGCSRGAAGRRSWPGCSGASDRSGVYRHGRMPMIP